MAAVHSLGTLCLGQHDNDPPSPDSRRSMRSYLQLLLGSLLFAWAGSCLAVNTYYYDSLSRLRIVTYGDGSQTQIQYGYDAAGNVISRKLGTVTGPNSSLNVDASTASLKYDALTDGLLILRYLNQVTGSALTARALGSTATRTDPTVIKNYLDALRPALDIDGNGVVDPATDGLLILRYLLGLRGATLVRGAADQAGSRATAPDVETYLQLLLP